MITLIVSTIGAPFLIDSLRSLRWHPSQTVIVLDTVGRSASALDEVYPLDALKAALDRYYPCGQLVETDPAHPWSMMNHCYNVGVSLATNPYVMCTHDDMEYTDYPYFYAVQPLLEKVQAAGGVVDGRRVVGAVFPEWEVLNQALVPNYPEGTFGLVQSVSPVSQVVERQAILDFGGFDEEFGVWYDAQLQAETHLRDWWVFHVPAPPMRHTSNRTYRLNNWGNGFEFNPKWGSHPDNFVRKYGVPFTRNTDGLDLQPVRDPRFRFPCE